MLQINHLTKVYSGDVVAVDDVSLAVEKGDLFAFIGHNGAGKTTLLKACAGIHPFDAGEVYINGVSIEKDPISCKQNTAYIPDNPDTYEYLTGIQYLQFICDIYSVSKEVREERITYYAQLLDIADDLGALISTYSHGMKQKLVLVSAFVHQPKLLLLDEPFVGLDPTVSFEFKELLKDYCAKGNAVFFSTHVLEVAEKLCNKVAIIKEGKLLASGSMEEVRGQASLEQLFLELNPHE